MAEMPYRIIPFVTGEIYHIYNRGTEKRTIFEDRRDYQRFLKTLRYYQLQGPKPKLSHFFPYQNFKLNSANKIVEILAYCLMPNHFHLLIKQIKDGGITEFITKTSLSFTKYYNKKYTRVGPLLQGQFKAVLIESDEQLLHISRYIHLNPLASFLVGDLNWYEWSSYKEYATQTEGICSKEAIQNYFKFPREYQQFILDQADYAQQLEIIKHKTIEEF